MEPTDSRSGEGDRLVREAFDGDAGIDGRKNLEEVLAELNQLIGLDEVKDEVQKIANRSQSDSKRRAAGLNVTSVTRHLVFSGNPGTGKTTVARLLGDIYRETGVLGRGHLVETSRTDLVAGFTGQTAIKTSDVVNRALGGVLFIDEAYSLSNGDQDAFGSEAIDTLVKLMEDNREQLVVVVAGYPKEMDEFMQSNSGLRSRFPKTINFADYSPADLVEVFLMMLKKDDLLATEEAKRAATRVIVQRAKDPGFGNARGVRILLEQVTDNQASRLAQISGPSRDQLMTIEEVDIPKP